MAMDELAMEESRNVYEIAQLIAIRYLSLYRILLSHRYNQSIVTKQRLRDMQLSKQYKHQILKDTRLCNEELGKRRMCAFSLRSLVYE